MTTYQSSPSTSTWLIHRVKENDASAWFRFCQLYTPLIYRWLRSSRLQHADATEVLQETFVTVSKTIHRFDADRGFGFRGWLWGITRNKLLQYQAKQRKAAQQTVDSSAWQWLGQVPEEPPDSPRESLAVLAKRAVDLIRSDFQPNTWQAFIRVVVQEEKPVSVAADLGMTIAAVYTAKSRVLAHLRAELAGQLD